MSSTQSVPGQPVAVPEPKPAHHGIHRHATPRQICRGVEGIASIVTRTYQRQHTGTGNAQAAAPLVGDHRHSNRIGCSFHERNPSIQQWSFSGSNGVAAVGA